jgi:hypothetical protein
MQLSPLSKTGFVIVRKIEKFKNRRIMKNAIKSFNRGNKGENK